jgi:hypothetical protein
MAREPQKGMTQVFNSPEPRYSLFTSTNPPYHRINQKRLTTKQRGSIPAQPGPAIAAQNSQNCLREAILEVGWGKNSAAASLTAVRAKGI